MILRKQTHETTFQYENAQGDVGVRKADAHLIRPEEDVTAAQGRVRHFDADLHGLRGIDLHILHHELAFWFPRHSSCTT
jgi:hypothetical protein